MITSKALNLSTTVGTETWGRYKSLYIKDVYGLWCHIGGPMTSSVRDNLTFRLHLGNYWVI